MRIAAVLAVGVFLLAPLLALSAPSASAGDVILLTVGDREEMKSRSALQVQLGPYHADEWTAGILAPAYSSLLIQDLEGRPSPYIAKGVDADGNGVFDADEYGVFSKDPGTNATDITVYLDFNGVRWHDGVQMDPMDVRFTLLVASLSPLYNTDLRVLWDRAGVGSNFTSSRWLCVGTAGKAWAGESSLPGDPALRVALRFCLHAPFARFYEGILGTLPILPRHVWELTGGGRHADFGRAIYPEGDPRAGQGIPPNETLYQPFDYSAAIAWRPTDADVIGSGPFRFTTWIAGAYTQLDRNDAYYVGTDPADPAVVYDDQLAGRLHRPTVQRIVFRVYRTTQLGVIALGNGEIQYYRSPIPAEFVPDLLSQPQIRVWANAGLGFTYLAYNLRRLPFGYTRYPPVDPGVDDVGRPLRLAFSHIVDKRSLVADRLLNLAYAANGPVSPGSTLWYNNSLLPVPFNLSEASRILDDAGWTDPPGYCQSNGTGCRSLPAIGTRAIELLTVQPDYDFAREWAGNMIAWGARAVGLNVVLKPMTFGLVLPGLQDRDFDMALFGWYIQDPDPDYLYSFYDCDTSPTGLNYAGYCDPEYDSVIERSRAEMSLVERQHLVRWAQGILMSDRPVEPLYFPDVIQATRQDALVNWSTGYGTLWTFWSWIGVTPPAPRPSRVVVLANSAMASGSRQPIYVVVRDAEGRPLPGAAVALDILTKGGGTFVETSGPTANGTTNSAGTFAATYEAPVVTEAYMDIELEAVVRDVPRAVTIQRGFIITVFPETTPFLSLRIALPAGDVTIPGSPLVLQLGVSDETGASVGDALVRGTVSPTNGTLDRYSGTAAEMSRLVFAPPGDLKVSLTYRLTFVASRGGYHNGSAAVPLIVVPEEPQNPLPPPPTTDDLQWRVAAGAVALTAAGVVALLAARRTLRRRP